MPLDMWVKPLYVVSPFTVLIVQCSLLFCILVTMRPLVFPALPWDDFFAYLSGLSVPWGFFSLQISNFFPHIVNCISLHTTRQRLRLCTCLEIKMKNRSSISFLSTYINVCKDEHGNSSAQSIHVLAEAWGCSCTLCSAVKHHCVVSPSPWLRLKPILITSL